VSPTWPASWGKPGAVAALALLAALVLGGLLAPRWQAQAAAARQARPALPATPPPEPVATLQLPVTGDAAERVAELLRLARRHGVDVQRTQQQLDRDGPLPRLQLGLTAQGRYAELRAFVAHALQADAGLALDRLHWRRSSVGSDELEADMQWSLWQAPARMQEAR
jgi:hypothetical protein